MSRTQGRYTDAEPLYQRSLEIRKKSLGEDHPDVATSLNNLALLLWRMGRLEEAVPYQERATKIHELRGETDKAAEYQRELDGLKAGNDFPFKTDG